MVFPVQREFLALKKMRPRPHFCYFDHLFFSLALGFGFAGLAHGYRDGFGRGSFFFILDLKVGFGGGVWADQAQRSGNKCEGGDTGNNGGNQGHKIALSM